MEIMSNKQYCRQQTFERHRLLQYRLIIAIVLAAVIRPTPAIYEDSVTSPCTARNQVLQNNRNITIHSNNNLPITLQGSDVNQLVYNDLLNLPAPKGSSLHDALFVALENWIFGKITHQVALPITSVSEPQAISCERPVEGRETLPGQSFLILPTSYDDQCQFQIAADRALSLQHRAELALQHYCTQEMIQFLMESNGFADDCPGYSDSLVNNPQFPQPEVPFTEEGDLPPPEGDISDTETEVMNSLLKSQIDYLMVLWNMTAMEEQHICRLDEEIGRECDAESVCNLPGSSEDHFFCLTYQHLVNVTWDLYQLLATTTLVMDTSGIPVEVEPPSEKPYPPGDVTEMEMRQYTQGGFYNTRELAISTAGSMDYLCSLDERRGVQC